MVIPEKTILLVDDNEHDAFLAERALRKSNIANRVVLARDGVEALDYLFGRGSHTGRDLREMPVVTLLDLKMPKVDGLEVLRQSNTVLPLVNGPEPWLKPVDSSCRRTQSKH